MSNVPNAVGDGQEGFFAQDDEEGGHEIYRWPPLGISTASIGSRSHICGESDRHPLPFIGREHRVNKQEWSAYLRRPTRRYKKVKGKEHMNRPSFGRELLNGPDLERPSRIATTSDSTRPARFPLDPIGKVALTWRIIIVILDATYSAFLIPIGCAFHWNAEEVSWYNVVDMVAGALFWLDVLMGFCSGYVAVYNLKRMIITRPSLIARFYVRYGTFWWDLISALPIIAEIAVLAISRPHGGHVALHVILLLRLFRLVRVYRMVEWLIEKSLAGQFHRQIQKILVAGQVFLLSILYAACVFINFLACTWYYVASWEGLDRSWLTSVGSNARDISGEGPVRQWVASVFFVVTSITTTGYGDIAPVNAAEELVAALIMLIGVVAFGFIIAGSQQVVQYLAPEARTLGLLRAKLKEADVWTEHIGLSNQLRARCNAYYTEVWLRHTEWEESHIFKELPAILQAEICYEKTHDVLAGHHMFQGLDKKAYMFVANRLQATALHAGQDLCKEGQIATCLWILEEGEVVAIKQGTEVEYLKEPALIGEAAALSDVLPSCHKREATYRAVTPLCLWRLDTADMDHIFHCMPEVLDSILIHFRDHLSSLLNGHSRAFSDEGWHTMLNQLHDSEAAEELRQKRLRAAHPHHDSKKNT